MQTSLQKSGHQFAVTSYDACARCHGSAANAQGIAAFVKAVIIQRTQQLKAGLDQWALQQSPTEIRAYGTLAWEYQKAGRLSSPDGTLSGPVSDPANPARDEQKYIPSTIKRARFNLYLVLNDGSHGVHNGPYAITLLDAAENWIQTELGN